MSNTAPASAPSLKHRQYLLLAGVVSLILGAAILSVVLTTPRQDGARPEKPKTTNILAPGAQVDPRDAWRGQADAQMKAIEQTSRSVTQKTTDLELQGKAMLERLKKLEQPGLTPLPPAPVPAPPVRPDLAPNVASKESRDAMTGPQVFPPAASPKGMNLPMPPGRPPVPVPGSMITTLPAQPAIISVNLGEGTASPKATGTGGAMKAIGEATKPGRARGNYIPSGSFTRAVLLGGLDAPTGGQAQKDPQPVLLRLIDNAILPNHFRFQVRECFVVGAGYGDLSSERAYIRTETLSCVTQDGRAIDVPIKGYVAGEDGKAGMRGRLVSKQGQLLANALIAGVASGIGHAFQQQATTFSVSPLGSTATVNQGDQLTAGVGVGVGKALDRLAQYYITLAEKIFPVIEVDAGRAVDIVITKGEAIEGLNPTDAVSDASLDALANRNRNLRRRSDVADH